MSDDIKTILAASPETIAEGRGILSRLWRLTLSYVKISYNRWEVLMDNYINVISQDLPPATAQNLKGNLLRALCEQDLTWANIVKGIVILNPDAAYIDFNLEKEGDMASYTVSIPTVKQIKDKGDTYNLETITQTVSNLKAVWCDIKENFSKTKSWNELLDEYSAQEYNKMEMLGENSDKKTRSSIKSRINKSLNREEISWRSFIIGLSVLGVEKLHIKLKLESLRSFEINLSVKL